MLGAISSIARGLVKCTLALSALTATAGAAPAKAAAQPADGADEAADSPDSPDTTDAPDNAKVTTPPISSRREGDYGGVKPGTSSTRDRPAKVAPRKGSLSWIGFESKPNGADVFLQSAGAFEVAQRLEKGVLVVRLTGLSQLGHNTWRFIDTRFFDTPIARIVAKRVGAARGHGAGIDLPPHSHGSAANPGRAGVIEVRISFKRAADAREATIRSATEADGLYYAYLAFPGGKG
jgi:hypothetical protein